MSARFLLSVLLLLPLSAVARRAKDFPDAQRQAKEQQADILVFYQGSDWCKPGVRIEKQIWSPSALDTLFPQMVLLAVDMKDLPIEKDKTDAALLKKWKPWNMPALALFDAEGRLVAVHEGLSATMTPADFVTVVKELRAVREARDASWADAPAGGIERAEVLGKGLAQMEFSIAGGHYNEILKEIRKLDPQGQTGYAAVYEFRAMTFVDQKIIPIKRKQGDATHQELIDELDTLLKNPARPIWQQQEIWSMKSAIFDCWDGHHAETRTALEKVVELDPESDLAIGARRQLEPDYKRAW